MKTYIIDRFEGKYAVCEKDGCIVNLDRALLPKEAKEGDVVIENEGKYLIDIAETLKRREKAKKLINKIFK